MSYWYPKVRDLVQTPRTELLETDVEFVHLCDGKKPDGYDAFMAHLREAVDRIGVPAFLRTGITSGKHFWRDTCHLTDPSKLAHHVYQLVEFSCIADLIGLDYDVWAVREMLPTIPAFYAFNGMPVTRERRYFVRDGEIVCHHPYWPAEAIKGHTDEPRWADLLAALSDQPEHEVSMLGRRTRRVGEALGGAWSVDWLWTERGWFLIDMADAGKSYHWPDCPMAASVR